MALCKLLLLLALAGPVSAAVVATTPTAIAWDDPAWRIEAAASRIEEFRGRRALVLENGSATLTGISFEEGVIEFDLAVPAERGFHGLAFRVTGEGDYEHFYIRSHLSGMPDATQYTPVFNGVTGWQIYTGSRFALPVDLEADRWMHVRVVVRSRQMEVAIDGQPLVYPELIRQPVPGEIALTTSLVPARFANLVVTHGAPPPPAPPSSPAPPISAGMVTRWRVSEPFPESRLPAPGQGAEWSDLKWATLETGVAGVANLAMIRARTNERNTVFAAVTLRATRSGPVRVRFGFSDRARVILNGQQIYQGNDRYQSRDYRFLGSIGLYDELILPLKRGDNQLWIAVSEDFGGWGVVMELPDGGAEVVLP